MPIKLDHVSYTYMPGTHFECHALQDVSLTIENGEFVGIMGHTGCGKSTLIQMIVGLLIPKSGTIRLDGKDINERCYQRAVLRRKVGVVFQYPEYQLFETTVERDVAFGLKHSGLSGDEVSERVRQSLALVGFDFDEVRRQSPLGFSGGEKRRIAIAGILASNPEFLILDEPIAGLDPLGRERFLELLDKLNGGGTSIIMVSHNADSLAEHASRLIILDSGKVLVDEAAAKAFSDAEELIKMRVGVSRPRIIADLLEKRGFKIPPGIIRYDDLLPCLIDIGRGGGKS